MCIGADSAAMRTRSRTRTCSRGRGRRIFEQVMRFTDLGVVSNDDVGIAVAFASPPADHGEHLPTPHSACAPACQRSPFRFDY